jgi:hypothetical protein
MDESFSGVARFVGHIFCGGFKQLFGIAGERSQIKRKPFSHSARMRHFQNGGLGGHDSRLTCAGCIGCQVRARSWSF